MENFRTVIELLHKERAELKALVEKLTEQIVALKKENSELRDRLGLNSTNSSIPPSKDLYKAKSSRDSKSTRKIGAQPGHKGTSRKLHEPNEIIHCYTPNLCDCGGRIKMSGKPEIQQKVEIPPIKPHYTNYVLHKGRCKCCNKNFSGILPNNVSQDMLGNNAKAIIASLTGYFKNSKSEVQKILKNIFDLELSIGTISNTEKRVSDKCKKTYETYVSELRASNYLHSDETSANNKGKRFWAWSFSNKNVSVLKIEESRGKKVLEKMLSNFSGVIVSDRFAAYNFFQKSQRQICWAHLLRDFKRFASSSDIKVSEIGSKLLQAGQFLFKKLKNFRRSILKINKEPPKNFDQLTFSSYSRLLKQVNVLRSFVNNQLGRILALDGAKHAARVAKRILSCDEMMWKFLQNVFIIEPTNNFAERQIRNFVIYRKNSFFVWSDRGAEFVERMHSIFMTSNLRNQNPFENLKRIIEG